jgi:hypothetical protein
MHISFLNLHTNLNLHTKRSTTISVILCLALMTSLLPGARGQATFGNISLRGPALYVFNLSLSKEFVIVENKTVELWWENFNAFNHVNLALPTNQVDVEGAGQTHVGWQSDAPDAIGPALPVLK